MSELELIDIKIDWKQTWPSLAMSLGMTCLIAFFLIKSLAVIENLQSDEEER